MSHTFIAVAAKDGKMSTYTAKGILDATWALKEAGNSVSFGTLNDCGFVAKARSYLAAEFLDSGADELLFVDADMRTSGSDIVTICASDAAADVICAEYSTRGKTPCSSVVPLPPDMKLPENALPGLIEVRFGATGFMLIKRRVIERMYTQWPQFQSSMRTEKGRKVSMIFDTGYIDDVQTLSPDENEWWGEDYLFCRRWRRLGGRIYCNPAVRPGHIGTKIFELSDLAPTTEQLDRVTTYD